mmetsp:Transcript_8077/g.16777  ORF Transcript_8077/g.16777 Transcript_8077/m.16777 type:complete len:211 (+) Transcript_8077:101-733(+)
MTAADISSVVLTVGFWQLVIDLLSNQMVFKKDPYQRSLRTMERFKGKVDRAENDLKKSEKHRKKFDRAKAEYQGACADVARRHFAPNIMGSLFFIILLRILGIENQGKVMGLLPFIPPSFISKVSARGLDWRSVDALALNEATSMHPKQAFSFFFVYAMCAMAVKYYVNRAVGQRPPKGADGGISTVMESPIGKSVMRSFGVNPDDMIFD